MKTIKPALEKIDPGFGSSVLVKKHSEQIVVNQAFWHFHPEVELVYIDKGQGKVHIGNHLSYFNCSQLLLLGANLPHHGFSDRLTVKGSETIVQFKPGVLGETFLNLPEMKSITSLLERAKKGVMFQAETKKKVGPKIQKLLEFDGIKRIILLLEILNDLAISTHYNLLNVDGFAFETTPQDSNKIDIIFKHINSNFERQIPLDEISSVASMTVPAFCRYFKKATGKTFTKLVNEYRVVHATKLLSESTRSITDICFECGFNNFSHFNKLFKEITGKSASKYRSEMKRLVQ
jgi:AraC-like DNA-binding protein